MYCLAHRYAILQLDPDPDDRHGAGHGGDDPYNDYDRGGLFVGRFQERLLRNPYRVSPVSLRAHHFARISGFVSGPNPRQCSHREWKRTKASLYLIAIN